MLKIVAISDTHQHFHNDLPPADILIHCGDFTNQGNLNRVTEFACWLNTIAENYNKIIVIAGNHELTFDEPGKSRGSQKLFEHGPKNMIYLNHGAVEIDGMTIFGSPFTPRFGDWAFNIDRGPLLSEKWACIPDKTDILITHGPPRNILDPGLSEKNVGCDDLMARVAIVKPRLHVFGHCHSGYGRVSLNKTLYVNAASCDERHNLVNKPQIISLYG